MKMPLGIASADQEYWRQKHYENEMLRYQQEMMRNNAQQWMNNQLANAYQEPGRDQYAPTPKALNKKLLLV